MPRVKGSNTHLAGYYYYDEDDGAALAELDPLGGSGEGAAVRGAASALEDRKTVIQRVSPVVELALRHLAIATIKAQARGLVPRVAKEWAAVTLSFRYSKPGDWHLLGAHLPLAIAAGISVDDIAALRAGQLDRLGDADKQHVEFALQVCSGGVTDESWSREVRLVGSERGVVELMAQVLLQFMHIRMAQAFGFPGGSSDADVDAMIVGFRNGSSTPGDVDAYERHYASMAWPQGEIEAQAGTNA